MAEEEGIEEGFERRERRPIEEEEEEGGGIPLTDVATMQWLTEPGIPPEEKLVRCKVFLNRELRTSNIEKHRANLLLDALDMAEDYLTLGLTERAERKLMEVIADLGLSKSVEGWQQRLFRTTYRSSTASFVEPSPKKRGLLPFGRE